MPLKYSFMCACIFSFIFHCVWHLMDSQSEVFPQIQKALELFLPILTPSYYPNPSFLVLCNEWQTLRSPLHLSEFLYSPSFNVIGLHLERIPPSLKFTDALVRDTARPT